jgi:hypothetical protein
MFEFLLNLIAVVFFLTGVLTWLVIGLSFLVWYFGKKEW